MNRFLNQLFTLTTACMLIAAPYSKASGLSADESWLTQESTPWTVNVTGK